MTSTIDTPNGEKPVLQSAPMADDALIRIQRLKALGLTPKQLSERVGNNPSYWHDVLAGRKSVGERISRKTEEKLGLPRYHLDHPVDSYSGAPTAPPIAADHVTPYTARQPKGAAMAGPDLPGLSRMALDLATEFDHMQTTDSLKRTVHATCMLLINLNPLLMAALGIANPAGGGEPPTVAPAHTHKKSSSPHRA